MATETLYGTYATDSYSPTLSSRTNVSPANHHGRQRVLWDTVTAAGGDLASIYYLGGEIPKGARIIDAWVDAADLGTSTTLSLLVGAVTLISAIDTDGAASFTRVIQGQTLSSTGVVLTADSKVSAVSAGGAATGRITACVTYAID